MSVRKPQQELGTAYNTGTQLWLDPWLTLETEQTGDGILVVACGDVDLDTEESLHRALSEAIDRSAAGVDLDPRGVGFCDCSGLNVLLRARRRAVAQGKTFAVRATAPAIERLLTMTATLSLFDRPDPVGEEEKELRAEVGQLRRAMETRPVIDLARGVLMASYGLSPDNAWGVLVTVSQHTNTKLHQVAGAVVETVGVGGDPLPEALQRQLTAAVAPFTTSRPGRCAG